MLGFHFFNLFSFAKNKLKKLKKENFVGIFHKKIDKKWGEKSFRLSKTFQVLACYVTGTK